MFCWKRGKYGEKRNRQKRISKKSVKKKYCCSIYTGWHDSSYSYGGSCSQDKNGHITGFIQRADYMKGEIEAVSSVDAVYDEDTVWQTEEQMLLKESMIEQTEIYEKENNENAEEEKTGAGTVKAAEIEESLEKRN